MALLFTGKALGDSPGCVSIFGRTVEDAVGIQSSSITANQPGTPNILFTVPGSDTNGDFGMCIDPGTYDLHFNPPAGSGLAPIVWNNYDVTQSVNQVWSYQPIDQVNRVFSGHLIDNNHDPIANVSMSLKTTDNAFSASGSTDSNGAFSMTVPAGLYTNLALSFNNLGTTTIGGMNLTNFSIGANSATAVNLTTNDVDQDIIVNLVKMHISALDSDGSPSANATFSYGASSAGYTVLGTGGTVTLPTLPIEGLHILNTGDEAYTDTVNSLSGSGSIGVNSYDLLLPQSFGDFSHTGFKGNQPVCVTFSTGSTTCTNTMITTWSDIQVVCQEGAASCLATPSQPSGLQVTSHALPAVLSWGKFDQSADSYNIYRDGVLIGNTTDTTYTDFSSMAGTYEYYVTGVNTLGEGHPSDTVSITYTPPTITSVSSVTTPMRQPLTFKITTTGSPAPNLAEAGLLPAGLTFTDNGDGTASFSGIATPGTVGSYPVTITATNGVGASVSQVFTLTVDNTFTAPTITSENNISFSYGAPSAFTVTTNGYPVPKLSLSGTLPRGLTFKDNHDGTATLSGTTTGLSIGAFPLSFSASSSAGNASRSFILSITNAPVLSTIPTQTVQVGKQLSLTLDASAYPYAVMAIDASLPQGLTFVDNGNSTATLSGTPAPDTSSPYTYNVAASNGLGSATQPLSLLIEEPNQFTSNNSAAAMMGQPFSFTITTIHYPAPKLKLTGKLPNGITFTDNNDGTATLSGVPTGNALGSYKFKISANNGNPPQASQNFTLTVN